MLCYHDFVCAGKQVKPIMPSQAHFAINTCLYIPIHEEVEEHIKYTRRKTKMKYRHHCTRLKDLQTTKVLTKFKYIVILLFKIKTWLPLG